MLLHGHDPSGVGGSAPPPGQPAVGRDPTQGEGTLAWQQALKMGMAVNARLRRN